MTEHFDPYHQWLGIPLLEEDPNVIDNAADQRMSHLRSFQMGPHSSQSQKLLAEVAGARVCLLNVEKKAAYDKTLDATPKIDVDVPPPSEEYTPDEQERLLHQREQIAEELPELTARDRMRNAAREETTLSGELRRAIHASELGLAVLADQSGIRPSMLDDFLTGQRTLRSDVIDRLATMLGCQLTRSK